MEYTIRPGIVRVMICGEYLLVPTRKASEMCPDACRIPLMAAALWEELEKGNDTENICRIFQKLSGKPREEIESRMNRTLEDLYKKGFLMKTGEESV